MNENSLKNLVAGIFVIFMIFVMIFIGFFLSGGFKATPTTTYVTNFRSISGLNVGSDVSYKGYKAGKVSNIEINKKNQKLVSVYMDINDNVTIFKQTVATLQNIGITGQSQVELSLDINKNDTKLIAIEPKEGSILETKSKPSQIDNIKNIIKKVDGISTSLEEIASKLNRMLSAENMERFNEFTDSINILLYNLSNSSIYFNKTLMNLNEIMTDSQETVTRLNNVMQLLEYDPSVVVKGVKH